MLLTAQKKIICLVFFVSLILSSIFFIAISPFAWAATEDETRWQFVYISDTHLGFLKTNKALEDFINEMTTTNEKYSFLAHTGDITEIGAKDALLFFKEKLSSLEIPVKSTIGNHDVRWSPHGKKILNELLGNAYYSFDYNGIHFIFLDTTIVHQTNGHITNEEIKWLKNDLAKLPNTTPIFIFSHHPIRWTGISVDNGYEVLKILNKFKAKIFFHGHSHNVRVLSWNNTAFVQNGALFNGDYMVVSVAGHPNKQEVKIEARTIGKPDITRTVAEAMLYQNKENPLEILSPKEDKSYERELLVKISSKDPSLKDVKAVLGNTASASGQFVVTLINNGINNGKGEWENIVNLEGLEGGRHYLKVVGTTLDGKEWDSIICFHHNIKKIQEVWKLSLGEQYASLQISGNILLAATLSGKVLGLDSKTGKTTWKFDAKGGVYGSSVIAEKKGEKLGIVATEEGLLYNFNLLNGKLLWQKDLGSPIYSGLAAFNNIVYCVTGQGDLVALDIDSGKVLWKTPLGSFTQGIPKITRSTIFIGTWGNKFFAVNRETGEIKWEKTIGKSIYYSPGVSSPYVSKDIVVIPAKDNKVYAYKIADGELLWEASMPAGYSSPAGKDGILYLATQQGKVIAINEKDGRKKWETSIGTPFFESSPIILKDTLLITSMDGKIFSLNLESGAVKWKYAVTNGYVISTPVFGKELLYVGSMDGYLYCLKLQSNNY